MQRRHAMSEGMCNLNVWKPSCASTPRVLTTCPRTSKWPGASGQALLRRSSFSGSYRPFSNLDFSLACLRYIFGLIKAFLGPEKKQHTVKSFGNCHQERGRNFRELEPEEEGRKKVKVGPEKFFLVVGCQSWEREKISSNYFFLLVENSFQHFFPVKPTGHLPLPFIWET